MITPRAMAMALHAKAVSVSALGGAALVLLAWAAWRRVGRVGG